MTLRHIVLFFTLLLVLLSEGRAVGSGGSIINNDIFEAPDDATRLRYSKAWNHLDLAESGSKVDPAVITKLADDILDNPALETFLEGGVGRVKAWEGLINIPAFGTNIPWLTRANSWIEEGGEFVTTNGLTKLRKNGQDILEIKNEKILPIKYDYPVSTGGTVGEASNGYQVVKNENILSVRRVPVTSGYSLTDIEFLTQHSSAHTLQRHGHDITDDALIKRATGTGSPTPPANKSYTPDGMIAGIPPYSSKFIDQQAVKDAIDNVKPGTTAFEARLQDPVTGSWVVEHPGNFGYGYASGGAGPVQMTKVTAVYTQNSNGFFELLTMYPNK